MLSKSSQLDKGLEILIGKSGMNLPHCSQNSTKIHRIMYCWKCVEGRKKGGSGSFDNTQSYFFHLKTCHNDLDRNCFPSVDNCIKYLQVLSDLISVRVLR
jgi:hypothetical protein